MEHLQIQQESPKASKTFEERMISDNAKKKRAAKGFLGVAGITIACMLAVTAFVVMTTDVTITSASDVASIGLSFFILAFCSYGVYVSCADSGTREGYNSKLYSDAIDAFNEEKKKIVDGNHQGEMFDFCAEYVENELKYTRCRILSDVGVSYDVYSAKYVNLSPSEIQCLPNIGEPQKKAIISANETKPIILTPDMIMKRGRGSRRRSPLGRSPEKIKRIALASKLVRTCIVSFMLAPMVFEVVVNPTWAMIAGAILKLCTIIANGFFGYKMGFENIAFDTANYITDQTDLMKQFLNFVENRPKETEK